MLGRFTVRPLDDDPERFGVWDGAVNGWRSVDLPDEVEAHQVATDLDVQFDAHGPRPAESVRRVEPAQRVQHAEWRAGELDVWVRDGGEWLGRVRDSDGTVSWIPGRDLRPVDDGA